MTSTAIVAPTRADVDCAAAVLDGVAHRTPVLTSRTLDAVAGARVLLKAEHLQRVGAFKFRGACHALHHLAPGTPVIAYSSGNHGQAVALAARLHGVAATVVMPHDAPTAKRVATEGYGATVVEYDRAGEDRAVVAARIAGQGTAALELTADHDLDALVVPLGGGGLLAGSILAVPPDVRVYGVEPAAGDDWARSLAAGVPQQIAQPATIADSLRASTPGVITWPIVSTRAAGVVTVTDDELVAAMAFALERLHQVLEPGGAAALAAVLARRVPGERIGVILSGGNVGAARLAQLLGQSQVR